MFLGDIAATLSRRRRRRTCRGGRGYEAAASPSDAPAQRPWLACHLCRGSEARSIPSNVPRGIGDLQHTARLCEDLVSVAQSATPSSVNRSLKLLDLKASRRLFGSVGGRSSEWLEKPQCIVRDVIVAWSTDQLLHR